MTDSPCATPSGLQPAPPGDGLSPEELRDRAELFIQFASTESHVLWVADLLPVERMVYVSPAFEAVWGYSAAQVYGEVFSWSQAIHPDDRDGVLAALGEWLAAPLNRAYGMEYRIVRPDGSIRWVHDTCHVARMEGPRASRITGIAEDITARVLATQGLQAERDRMAAVIATAPAVIHSVRLDAQGRLRFELGADRVAMLYGVAESELRDDASRALPRTVHPDDRQAAEENIRRSMRTGEPFRADFRVLHPDRGERWLTAHSVPTREPDRSIVWVGALTDITERKRTEQALQRSQAQLAAVFANLNEGLVICRPDGTIVDWNRAAREIYGADAQTARPLSLVEFAALFEVRTLTGDPLPPARWPLARVLAGERVHRERQVLLHRRDGWHKVCSYTGSLVRGADGQTELALLLVSDETERHQAEQDVRRLNAELEQRVAERTAELRTALVDLEAFSVSVSHDLRAPLNAIDGFAQILVDQHAAALPADGQRYLHIVRDTARHMGQLIDDLLAFARTGRESLTRRQVDMHALVEHVRGALQGLETAPRVEWVIGDLPPCDGDLAMLRQVWINLLSNALKYSRRRELARIEIGSQRRPDGRLEYVVSDNGCGFDLREAGRLFGVFERLHRADEYEGTGVGLAIVRRILLRHGGDVRAESSPGQGATFSFWLG